MINETRVNEIRSQITAFSEKSYTKAEALPEFKKLQTEVVNLTFNADHAENGDLRLWDVTSHFRKLNKERNYPADEELAKFERGAKDVCNLIKAEISGNYGEQKVFQALDELSCENTVLHNVELEFDGRRTEIDAIAFTHYAIFIVEIKNSKKNIFIDEEGRFYRTGRSMHFDGNIAEKMDEREALLRKALERTGMDHLKIFKIVTFSNSYLDVENKYRYIKVCGSNYLTTFIEKFTSSQWYSSKDICTMKEAVEAVRCPDAYQMSIDMEEFKENFARLMTILESAEEMMDETEDSVPDSEADVKAEVIKNSRCTTPKQGNKIVAAVVGISLINVALYTVGKLLGK